MPWEKSFEESEVIDSVMELFWHKGYEATSISDITNATGVQRGSLYNAFDGKQELFSKSISKYTAHQIKQNLDRLRTLDDPCDAITKLFEDCVKHSASDPEKKGVHANQHCPRVFSPR